MSVASGANAVRIRAPGKLVLSGAYSVLWGAPAIVAAVSRGAIADTSRPAVHVADEVRAAIDLGMIEHGCYVNVSELRAPTEDGGSRKLGLGSSAAIVVATLAAMTFDASEPEDAQRARLFTLAMRAHKHVQPDGSGVDVAASTFGGVLDARIEEGALRLAPRALPARVRVVAARRPASTKDMVAQVRAFADARPGAFARILERASSGAEAARDARDEEAFIAALRIQDGALRELARESGAPIFTAEFDELARRAERDGAFFGPSGAGGGDVGIHVGSSTEAFATGLGELGVDAIDLTVGAPGVERMERWVI
ncbi:MAG: hypothetical protein U0414_28135 [Polyangiaceae bacterium]